MGEPIRFELEGDGVTVTCTTAAAGAAELTYRTAHVDLAFSGDDLSVVATTIGTLVTVVLDVVPDHKIASFTLVVPEVRFGDDDAVEVTAVGLRTDERSSIAPSRLRGQLQRSTSIPLSGRARPVEP